MFIPVIAAVQFVFTLACAYLMAAGNVFFRDLGNVESHVLRLVWFLSPGLYSLAVLDELYIFKEHPFLRTLAEANPFAILFTAYRTVIYGTSTSLPGLPDFASLLASCSSRARSSSRSRRSSSSGSSRTSRRSSDAAPPATAEAR